MSTLFSQFTDYKNFAFVGETGSGKSEIALNFATILKAEGRKVHFFDLDQTKPLFRSRDVKDRLEGLGILFHYENQFYDAPTTTAGVAGMLTREGDSCILDVGGNNTGSRALGGFASTVNHGDTTVYFVLNPYRPWSKKLTNIDETLSAILNASGVATVRIICNSTIGYSTTTEIVLNGIQKAEQLLDGQASIDFITVNECLLEQVKEQTAYPVFPIKTYLRYPWTME